ncbi:PVC-type heme-binding CxxCH protein [Brevifollis gellanilyticus]|uniref:Cytochrome c n=1 Tax=Brevifollis gellanilyticus TaxID=748831 RepID=A0A512MEK0_9BACT|nr:PVC-type heme-binding CxxCH protein [Brevifollis gellanilyticus]GEP45157.1 cytochrome c [Brevifollis gellanilyticus]
MLRYLSALSLLTAAHLSAADFPKPFNSEKGDPMPAEEVARTMKLPPGFKCVVFAAEPDVQQPIAMSWDAKGRLWVGENYTYAENPARWDTNLRDRVIILEDKDGDGKHDGRKVFWEGGTYLTSVEIGYGGVWVLNAGTLSFIPDKNGDDVPDAEPEVLLDGFNVKTIGHNIVNGLRWGPDGWLYGRHGITDTSAVGAPGTPLEKRTKINCAIWRYHPTRKVFEAVAHGGTNSWGHDWNAEGELFMINTVIGHLWHVIPGAYYRRMFGTHLNPYVYEIIEQTADHFHWDTGSEKWSDIRTGISNKTLELGGGHAHVGMLIYQGGTWPKEYNGAVLTCNLHGNRINMDKLERQGCGYVGKHAPDFMQAQDKWFRGIDLITGPDGNVFVSDWSDSGECHDNDGVHRTSGRIYKIVYGETKKAEPTDLTKMSTGELRKKLEGSSSNNWWTRQILGQLEQRWINEPKDRVEIAKFFIGPEGLVAGRVFDVDKETGAYWTSCSVGDRIRFMDRIWLVADLPFDDGYKSSTESDVTSAIDALTWRSGEDFKKAFVNTSPDYVRGRLSEDTLNGIADIPGHLNAVMEEFKLVEKSGLVRLHLASSLQRLPLNARWPIATALAQREEDANDRQQPLMIWYGIEPAVAADPVKGVEFIASAKLPTVRRLVARRIVEDIEKNPAAVDALVALISKNDVVRGDVLAGMTAGLEGFSQAPKPKGWDEFASANGKGANAESLQKLSLIFGSGRASDELIAIVKNAEGDANARVNAFKSLTRATKPELMSLIRGLVNDKVLGIVSRSALAAYDDASIPGALLKPWPVRSEEQQAASVATLVTRPSYAKELLEAVKAGRVPKSAITPYQARAIRSLNDEGLTKKLTEVWGELRDTPEAKKAELADWTKKLTPERLTKGEAVKGKVLFMAACGACHKLYGEGGAIGPDLTGGDRHKITYLLENILDPSAIVPADYRMSVFKLKDGRTITGVIPQQTERSLTIQTPAERLTIEKTQIVEQTQLPMSLMPEGLLGALGEENVVHLIAYLQSLGPVR